MNAPLSPPGSSAFEDMNDRETPDSPDSSEPSSFHADTNLDFSKPILRLDPNDFTGNEVLAVEFGNQPPFFLSLNSPGNKPSEALSYMLAFSDGKKVLLPVYQDEKDYFFKFSDFNGMVSEAGEIILQNNQGSILKINKNLRPQEGTKILAPKPGTDGYFEGKINHHPFAAFTLRECGNSKYANVNEDSIAINLENGCVAIGDGLGGCEYSSFISWLAASTFVQAKGTFRTKTAQAWVAVKAFQAYQHYPKVNPEEQEEQKDVGDTTLVGLHIEGDTLDTMSLGDSGWCLVRDGEVIAFGREHNSPADKYYSGEMSEEQKWTASDLHAVTATLNYSERSDGTYIVPLKDENGKQVGWSKAKGTLQLQKGDRVYAFTDGTQVLNEEDFIAVSHLHPKKALSQLKNLIEERNIKRTFVKKLENGKEIILKSPRDNTTLFVYAHEDEQAIITQEQEIIRRKSQEAFQDWITKLQLEQKHPFLKNQN